MRQLSRYDLLHAVADHDTGEVRSLLRQAERQHLSLPADFYPELPEIIRWLYHYFPRPGKPPFAERYWQVLPDAAYEILELLRPFYDFGERVKLWHNHFLYQPILHEDIRMLEYLWTLDPLKHRARQQPLGQLFRAAVEDFCYMRLPDWEGLPPDRKNPGGYSIDLGAKDWLETLYAQAERCHIGLPEHLEFLLKHRCPRNRAKFKLQLQQPDFALRMWHDRPSDRNWEITDRNLTHKQGQDCDAMVKACIHDGEYSILTCVCGVPACANVRAPVLSMIFGDVARWRVTSSEDDEEPRVYYLAVPVADYLRDIDLLLAAIGRGIKEDGVSEDGEPDSGPSVEFPATAHSLKKVKTLRDLIRRKLSGEKIPEFKKKTGTELYRSRFIHQCLA